MALSRRTILTGAGLAAALAASPSDACSLTARLIPIGFSDAACRRSLRRLVDLINDAPGRSDAEVTARAAQLRIRFDDGVSDPILNYPNTRPIEDLDLLRGWSISDAKRDRSPLTIKEVNLLKGKKGIALYQFTLRRDRFHAGMTEEEVDGGSCDVAFEAYYGHEDRSYLGVFKNNQLREVYDFEQWLREL